MLHYKLKTLWSYVPTILVLLGILFANFYKPLSILNIEENSASSTLYFSGAVTPIKVKNIFSPVQGVLIKVNAKYGQIVKKNQLLYIIKSTQIETDYRSALESYIKAKSAYQNMVFQSTGNAELYKLGLISKIDFINKQEELKNSGLELWDNELQLKKIYQKTGNKLKTDVQTISLDKIENLRDILSQPLSGVRITAKADGVLFFPSKGLGSKEEDTRATEGLIVQEGQMLAVIADVSGFVFEVNVDETNFNDIKPDQEATITGNAFGTVQLTGKVVSINHQANNTETGEVPSYRAKIVVPNLTEAQRKAIQMGMSAEIAIIQKKRPPIRLFYYQTLRAPLTEQRFYPAQIIIEAKK